MRDPKRRRWCVYLLRCGDGTLYGGVTNDLEARLAAHRGERPGRGAKYTRGRGPLALVWRQAARGRAEAHRLEYRLKRLSRAEKLELIARDKRLRAPPSSR